jgi:hypothetical protein
MEVFCRIVQVYARVKQSKRGGLRETGYNGGVLQDTAGLSPVFQLFEKYLRPEKNKFCKIP